MATVKEAQAVKSLNTTPGRRNRRFVFKSFAQRIEELEIDVFRSLDPLKSEPSSGSSFFLDCIIHWRELNTAEDFISFYEEMMPLVQTLPLVLLHKDIIISRLLSRLQMKARLSLEPILRLISELSRDLLEDFLPFLPRIIESYLALLQNGAAWEPEIVEQIFTSCSYIMMYLQKYLARDVVQVLKVTLKLRYYPKDFVQEFMAEALSFLLRNASTQQLIKGIRKVLCEAARKPSPARKSGVSALLWHVMRGTTSKFHSRADRMLRLLIDNSTLSIGDKFARGSGTVTDVVIAAFERSCMELDPVELKLMWDCLSNEINDCINGGSSLHLSHLLSVLISTIAVDRGRKVSDYKPMLELVGMLIQAFNMPSRSGEIEGIGSEVPDKILQLMLCMLDGIYDSSNLATISSIALQWAPAFQWRSSSLLPFLKQLLRKDYALVAFRNNIMSAFSNLVDMSNGEVVNLMLTFCEDLQVQTGSCNVLEGIVEEKVLKICCFLREAFCNWIRVLDNIKQGDLSCSEVNEEELALLWGIIRCTPHFLSTEGSALLLNLMDVLNQLLMTEADDIAGISRRIWQSLIGAALNSYHNAGGGERSEVEHTSTILGLAKKYKSSRQVLSVVADYLDLIYGSILQVKGDVTTTHPELEAAQVVDALNVFSENLYNPDKRIRVLTLKILCHYELLNCESLKSKQLGEQHMKTSASESNRADTECCNVFKLLLTIEETPISIATSRKLTLLVSKIQTCVSTMRVSETYVLPAFYGIIGILYNQFMDLSNSAFECLSVMIYTYPGLLWDRFIGFFEQCQAIFLKTHALDINTIRESYSATNELVELFRVFYGTASYDRSCSLILCLLLQVLQKIPVLAESHSRQIVPLYFKFMGYEDESFCVGSFDPQICQGKDWKLVLMEWLNLLKLMKNSRSFYRSQLLKEVLVNRVLDDNDADLQTKVLDCLLNWKDTFLLPYESHLKNLISSKCLREELATWSLSIESNLIEEEHRAQLVPLITRILMPKVRSLRTLASRKHASLNNRKAVLGFIAQLHVNELPLFFLLLMKSLWTMVPGSDDTENWIWSSRVHNMHDFQQSGFLDHFTRENIFALPWKKRHGFLHVVEDIFGVFDASRVRPFLDLLMGCVVRILESCASSLHNRSNNQHTQLQDPAAANTPTSLAVKQFKDMRSLCLKIISLVLNKYEDHDFGSGFWDLFFKSVEPLIIGFKQEGSSSEKPSSLFFCFLAMSQSQNLVPLLCREKNLIPDTFSILSVPTASEAIVSSVLKFIENLLNLERELQLEKNTVREVLLSNLEALVDSLHHLFHNNPEKKRKFLKHPGETVLSVFKLLSKFIKDQSAAKKFVDILLPLACDGIKNSDVCMEALQILRDVTAVLGSESTTKILHAVSPILVSAGLVVRMSVCDLLDALAENDSSIISTAKLVRELNATSGMDMDFDTIFNAYDQVSVDYFRHINDDQALVILSHCIYDMMSEEFTIRRKAYGSLLSFVDFSALVTGEVEADRVQQIIMVADRSSWTDAHIQRIVNKFLLKHMGDAMSKEASKRQGWIDLLHKMVEKLSGVPSLRPLKALQCNDAEVDFFANIVHLQIHRRARALSRFSNIVVTGQLSEFILKRVFIPLFFSILFEVQTGKREHVRSACLDALASVSGQLGWKSYHELLMRCFRDMAKKPDRGKVFIRLVCSILDRFHFSETCSIQDAKAPGIDLTEHDPVASSPSVISAYHHASSTKFPEIQSSLTRTVLPMLQKMLVSDSEKVNVNVSLAMLKVLKLLPIDAMESQLPSIIHRISNFLKHRLESIRDEARLALAACLKELGFEHLQFIVKVLKSTLKRGFERHVLGYTLHFILSKGLPNSVGGELDYCLDELLGVVDDNIFGEVAEQKDVEKVASKMKETRKQMSFGTLKLIAQNVTFKTHGLKLLSPVIAHLHKHLTPKVNLKLETMLNHIAEGVERNSSVDQTDLFIFVYGLIDDWLSKENSTSEVSSAKEKLKEASCKKLMKGDTGNEPLCSHLITVFALRLFYNRMKSIKFDRGNDQLLSMLNPFIKMLTSCLSSKYEEIISVSLACIYPLLRFPLPSLESYADKIKATLLDIAQSSSNVNSTVTQSCLKLLTALLRSTKITLSKDQLHVLIQFPFFSDLEKNPSFVALTLLKAIVRRKLVVHEIYNVVTQVAELMVTSQEEAIRRKCSQILLQFLLNYQLSQKRRQQHLDFLVANLRYEHATGREAVLEMLNTIIKRFPESMINEQSQTLFVHLVVALANDHDNQVRSLIGLVIKHLISRIGSQSLHSILEYCLAWYLGEKQHLWSTSAQVLGFVVEVMKRGFQKHISNVLPVMKKIMHSSVAVLNDMQLNLLDQGTIPFWKEAYYSSVLLEKILTQFPDLCFLEDIEDILQAISELLMHPHPWVCNISSRLLALYSEQMGKQGKKLGTTCLTSTGRLFLIAASLCCLIKVQLHDEGVRKHVKANLAFAVCGIQSLLCQTEYKDPCIFWTSLDPHMQGCFLKACRLLDAKNGRSIEASFTCGFDNNFEQKDHKDLSSILVSGLLTTMGKITLQTEDIQTKTILGSLELIVSQFSQEECEQYAILLLFPIYKLCEGFSGKEISDDVKQCAEKVREKMEEKLGGQLFLEAYSQIRRDIGVRRNKRKREEKLMAVVNPARNAKRKLRMSAKHKAHKKRKIVAMKMGRWMR